MTQEEPPSPKQGETKVEGKISCKLSKTRGKREKREREGEMVDARDTRKACYSAAAVLPSMYIFVYCSQSSLPLSASAHNCKATTLPCLALPFSLASLIPLLCTYTNNQYSINQSTPRSSSSSLGLQISIVQAQ